MRTSATPKRCNKCDIVQVTSKEYRQMAGLKRFTAYNEGLKKLHHKYKKIFAEMPLIATQSTAVLLEQYRVPATIQRIAVASRVEAFWKRMARMAVDAIAKFAASTVRQGDVRSARDWSKCNGIKGHAPSPVKRLKQALHKLCDGGLNGRVHDEQAVTGYCRLFDALPLRTTRSFQKRGRTRAVDPQQKLKQCFGVLRGECAKSSTKYWDRDVKAAINMLPLLKSDLDDEGCIQTFRRAEKRVEA